MTICFEGCDFKYETESVTKLFLPFEHFKFLYDENIIPDGDYIIMSEREGELASETKLGGVTKRRKTALKASKTENEEAICGLLFENLSEITGISPKWGCLTGIRPVRKVKPFIDGGKARADIYRYFRDKYFVSEEKTSLACDTYENQRDALKSSDKNSFSLYIGIPFCPTKCAYCSFVSSSVKEAGAKLIPEYTDRLCEELEVTAGYADKLGLKLDTIYIGGGTPTAIPPEYLEKIMKKTAVCFNISDISEYTVEAGRADTITAENLRVILENGAERISVNPQSMVEGVLKAAGRRHTAEQVVKAFSLAREAGFKNINMDIIAGLPTDTAEGFKYTVDAVSELDPEAVTVHTLTLKRSAELFSRSEEIKRTVSPDTADEMVSYARTELARKGYGPYYLYRQKNTIGNLENVGYSKKGRESLYNIYIMDDSRTILAAGAGSSTKIVDSETGLIRRVINYKYPFEYIKDFDKMLEKKRKAIFG